MNEVSVEISARHIHLSQGDLEDLFGKGFVLDKFKDLSQEGEFASKQTVTLKTPNKEINNVRILGPCRRLTQVEISKTDAHELGFNPPMKECTSWNGEMADTITICNGDRCIERAAVIVAYRHFHLNPGEARNLNLKDNDQISVRIAGERALIFDNILVRVAPNFNSCVHLDIDEGNAANIIEKGMGEIIK